VQEERVAVKSPILVYCSNEQFLSVTQINFRATQMASEQQAARGKWSIFESLGHHTVAKQESFSNAPPVIENIAAMLFIDILTNGSPPCISAIIQRRKYLKQTKTST
jgi:hypothetical protein